MSKRSYEEDDEEFTEIIKRRRIVLPNRVSVGVHLIMYELVAENVSDRLIQGTPGIVLMNGGTQTRVYSSSGILFPRSRATFRGSHFVQVEDGTIISSVVLGTNTAEDLAALRTVSAKAASLPESTWSKFFAE